MRYEQDPITGLLVPARERPWVPRRVAPLQAGIVGPAFFSGASPDIRLLCHFDGSDGSTSIVDSSSYGQTLAGNANCKISTTRSKFGASSLRITQSDSGGATLASSVFGRGADQPWCFDFWVYVQAIADSVTVPFVYWTGSTSRENAKAYRNLSNYRMQYDNEVFGDQEAVGVNFTTATWIHIAYGFDGTSVRRFKDGVSEYTYTGSRNAFITTPAIRIGGATGTPGAADATDVYIDEFRLKVGACDFVSNFTPPTDPY